MEPLSIDLPEPLRRYIDERIATGQFDSPSDYFRDLIERERDARARLEELLLEALDDESEPIEVNDAFWDERAKELKRQIALRKLA